MWVSEYRKMVALPPCYVTTEIASFNLCTNTFIRYCFKAHLQKQIMGGCPGPSKMGPR